MDKDTVSMEQIDNSVDQVLATIGKIGLENFNKVMRDSRERVINDYRTRVLNSVDELERSIETYKQIKFNKIMDGEAREKFDKVREGLIALKTLMKER